MSLNDKVSNWLKTGGAVPLSILDVPDFGAEIKRQIVEPWNLYSVLSAEDRYRDGIRRAGLTYQWLRSEAEKWVQTPGSILTVITIERAWELFPALLRRELENAGTPRTRHPLLRLKLLGACGRVVLGGGYPTLRGRLILAALAILPDEGSFDYPDTLKQLSLEDNQADLKFAMTALTTRRDVSPLQSDKDFDSVINILGKNSELQRALESMEMPVDQRILVWSRAARAVNPAPVDRWASLSHNELLAAGRCAMDVVNTLLEVAKKERIVLDSHAPDISNPALWKRTVHITTWSRKTNESVAIGIAECSERLAAGCSALGSVLLHLLILGVKNRSDADAAIRTIGLAEVTKKTAVKAHWEGDWAFFNRESETLSGAECLAVANGYPPNAPPELQESAEILISECRRRSEVAATAMLQPGDEWIAQLAFARHLDVEGALEGFLKSVRQAIVQGPSTAIADLSDNDRFYLAELGKKHGLGTESVTETIVDNWVAEIEGKLTVRGAALSQAKVMLETARLDLINGGPGAVGSLARALWERNTEAFELETAPLTFTRPERLGEPFGLEKWRTQLISRRAFALLLVLAILLWLAVTYFPGAAARQPDVGVTGGWTFPDPLWETLTWKPLNGKIMAKNPVDKELYYTVAVSTAPSRLDATSAQVTFQEAARWCNYYERLLRTQNPSLFFKGRPLFGLTARLPTKEEIAVDGVAREWFSESGRPGRLGEQSTLENSEGLGALGQFRIVFAPSQKDSKP